MFDFPSLRAAIMLAVLSVLSGCNFNGTYPDATEPDAAKLRFISNVENTTMTLFDAKHCEGQNTGLLNNLFTTDTRRRVDMSIAPPANTRGYLEIRLKPGNEVFVQTNTVSTGSVCTVYFNFTPQASSEYEVTFDYVGNRCRASLELLRQVGNKVVRSPLPMINQGLPACAGSNALFPKPLPAQPDTPERTAMIERVIAESIIPEMRPSPQAAPPADQAKAVERMIEERKKRIGFTLPDAYWDEYRRSLSLFSDDATHLKDRALQLYTDEYRARLRRTETDEIRKLLPDSASADESRALAVNNSMLQFYYHVKNQVLKESLSNNLARLADLDRRYAVCDRYTECWKN
ncbi:hypothetical protein SAMN05216189_101239 [Pseudomonas delhiensis]|uniref:Lipoprotein n=1 Tax=Pseudomonas delhiensis TaxID=366289 RepID=A0A239MBF0_9PSED|nr:hypothetical protein [Pseudomonas delhiensis]SDJ06273.1 hypothetical protein SAMN05216189_101239 [Pseudomonas delhiensis]SNT40095.1 hypothetical protein SAMN06295949_12539 [Pseudomonas delhiensis]